jgi:hypothetical protein
MAHMIPNGLAKCNHHPHFSMKNADASGKFQGIFTPQITQFMVI